jgi:hypothetical protein
MAFRQAFSPSEARKAIKQEIQSLLRQNDLPLKINGPIVNRMVNEAMSRKPATSGAIEESARAAFLNNLTPGLARKVQERMRPQPVESRKTRQRFMPGHEAVPTTQSPRPQPVESRKTRQRFMPGHEAVKPAPKESPQPVKYRKSSFESKSPFGAQKPLDEKRKKKRRES